MEVIQDALMKEACEKSMDGEKTGWKLMHTYKGLISVYIRPFVFERRNGGKFRCEIGAHPE